MKLAINIPYGRMSAKRVKDSPDSQVAATCGRWILMDELGTEETAILAAQKISQLLNNKATGHKTSDSEVKTYIRFLANEANTAISVDGYKFIDTKGNKVEAPKGVLVKDKDWRPEGRKSQSEIEKKAREALQEEIRQKAVEMAMSPDDMKKLGLMP